MQKTGYLALKGCWCRTVKKLIYAMIMIVILLCAAPATFAEKNGLYVPTFSPEGGVYREAQEISIIAPEGCEIWYTLDCTDPAVSETAHLYKEPVKVEKSIRGQGILSQTPDITTYGFSEPAEGVTKAQVIRAVCKTQDGEISAESIGTWLIGPDREYYETMPIISLVTDYDNLFSSSKGIYVLGDQYYAWKESETYNKDTFEAFIPANYNSRGKEWERPCYIQLYENGRSVFAQNVGMRIHGNWSRRFPQKSITLYARKEYGEGKMKYPFFGQECKDANGNVINKFDRILLLSDNGDGGVSFRDELNSELMKNTYADTHAYRGCILFINGELWGLYSMQEKQDEHHLSAHYGVSKDNITIIKTGSLDEGSEAVAKQYENVFTTILHMDPSDERNMAWVRQVLDLDSFIDLMVCESYIANKDFANNWSTWRVNDTDPGNPYADGRWRFILYDTDYSEKGHYVTYDSFTNLVTEPWTYGPGALFEKLMQFPEFSEKFNTRFDELLKNVFSEEKTFAAIDAFAVSRREAIHDTDIRFGTEDLFEDDLNSLRTFFRGRTANVCGYLRDYTAKMQKKDDQTDGINRMPDAKRNISTHSDASGTLNSLENGFTLDVFNAGKVDWHFDVGYSIPLESNQNYCLSFTVQSESERTFRVAETNAYSAEPTLNETLLCGPTACRIALLFASSDEDANGYIDFLLGGDATGTIVISDITLEKVIE